MSLALINRSIPTTTATAFDRRNKRPRPDSPNRSAEIERSLADRIRRGDRQAFEQLVLTNLGLVGAIARSYLGNGLCFEDLKQEGIRGLIRACSDYDPETHDARFSTYAAYWIRNTIQKAIESGGSMIRLSNYMIRLRSQYLRTLDAIREERSETAGDRPTQGLLGLDDEIAARMGITLETLDLVRRCRIERARFHDDDDRDGASRSIEESIPDDARPLFDLETVEELNCLHEGIALLSPIEAWVIRHRFGFEAPNDDGNSVDRAESESEAVASDSREAERLRKIRSRGQGRTGLTPRSVGWIARTYRISSKTVRRCERNALFKLRAHMRKRVGGDED